MIVNLDVITLKSQVTVELHLLTSDTRTLGYSLLSGLTVDIESFYSLQVSSLILYFMSSACVSGCFGSKQEYRPDAKIVSMK